MADMMVDREARPLPFSRHYGVCNYRGLLSLTGREALRGLRDYHYQIFGPILSSLLYLAIFAIALGQSRNGEDDLIRFLVPGLVIFAIFEKSFESAAGSLIFDKHLRMIEDILMAPLTAGEKILGYSLGNAAAGLAIGLCVALASTLFAPITVSYPLAFAGFAIAAALLGALIGILTGIFAQKWDHYAAIHTFLLLPLAFLSGIFYDIANLPPVAQTIIRFNPIFYMIDGFRYAALGESHAPLAQSALILALVILALGLLAYERFRRSRRLRP